MITLPAWILIIIVILICTLVAYIEQLRSRNHELSCKVHRLLNVYADGTPAPKKTGAIKKWLQTFFKKLQMF